MPLTSDLNRVRPCQTGLLTFGARYVFWWQYQAQGRLAALLGGFGRRTYLLQHLADSPVVRGLIDLWEVLGAEILPELLHVSLGPSLLQVHVVRGHVYRRGSVGLRYLLYRLMAFFSCLRVVR